MTSTIELTAREFRDLVSPVLPLASRDVMTPVLTAVHILSYDGYLVAEATDRFRMGRCRRPHEDAKAGDLDALVYVDTLKRILDLFKPGRGNGGTIRLDFDDEKVTVSAADALSFGFASASFSFALADGEFPKLAALFASELNREQTASNFAVNAAFLADFRHVIAEDPTITIRASRPDKPLVIASGDHFIGMLMTRKRVDGGLDLPDWDDHLATPAKKDEAAA